MAPTERTIKLTTSTIHCSIIKSSHAKPVTGYRSGISEPVIPLHHLGYIAPLPEHGIHNTGAGPTSDYGLTFVFSIDRFFAIEIQHHLLSLHLSMDHHYGDQLRAGDITIRIELGTTDASKSTFHI
jgi:hypothetical protein